MTKTILFISYKLKNGVSEKDFLEAAEKLNNEYMSKQEGYISWQQLKEKDCWVDMITFKRIEDAKRVEQNKEPNPLAEKFYAYIKLMSCRIHYYSIERSYK